MIAREGWIRPTTGQEIDELLRLQSEIAAPRMADFRLLPCLACCARGTEVHCRPHTGTTACRPFGKRAMTSGSAFMVCATMARGVWVNQSVSDTSEK